MRPEKPPKYLNVNICPATGKQSHRTENGAAAHLYRLTHSKAYDGREMHTYLCRCGMWHVGHVTGLSPYSVRQSA